MTDLFYITYPKKSNIEENTGFIDIYDLDQRFILLNILEIENLLIEGVIDLDNLFDINSNLGNRSDFFDQINKALELGISSYLKFSKKDFKDEEDFIEVLYFWKTKGIKGFILDFKPSYESSKILKKLDIFYIKLSDFKEKAKFEKSFFKKNNKNIYLKNYVHKVNEYYEGNFIALNKKSINPYILNFSNFYLESAKIFAIISILTKAYSFIREGEEFLLYKDKISKNTRKDLFNFYKKLSLIKYKYSNIIKGSYLPLYKKDKDILAYLFYNKGECLVILINLSQKDVLLDLLNIFTDFKFLLGNISRRRIVKTLNLRAYEAIVFECRTKVQIANN